MFLDVYEADIAVWRKAVSVSRAPATVSDQLSNANTLCCFCLQSSGVRYRPNFPLQILYAVSVHSVPATGLAKHSIHYFLDDLSGSAPATGSYQT